MYTVRFVGCDQRRPVERDILCLSGYVTSNTPTSRVARYLLCVGDDGLKEYETRTTKGKAKESATVRSHMRVYFPSEETVVQSRGGQNVG